MRVAATFAQSEVSYEERFEGYEDGADPNGWYGTKANNSMVEDDSLFQVYDLGENRAFGAESKQRNIHTH